MINRLAGNKRVTESIENLIRDSHLPHAVIIDGDEGTGRHTLAEFLCAAAICTGTDAPCGECRDCTLHIGHNHPDIEYFSPEEKKKSLSVDQVRKIRSNAYVKPHRSGKKIFVIDKADALSEAAQNTLLKIIEEPPQNIMFIFICESAGKMLDTVISRCVIFSLFPPESDEAFDYIKANSRKSDEEIQEALRLTHNNIGKALSILGKRKNEKNYLAEKFLNAVLEDDSALSLLLLLKPLEKDRVQTSEFISELKLITAERIRSNADNLPFVKNLLRIYETIGNMEEVLTTNINLTLFFTTLVANLVIL